MWGKMFCVYLPILGGEAFNGNFSKDILNKYPK